jgi:putative ABC transport system permease protein
MTPGDYLITSFKNIRKNRLRSLLTIVGVAVAIGALTSMLSFGIGLQNNIHAAIGRNRLLNRITVTAHPDSTGNSQAISDSLRKEITQLKGVRYGFTEALIPVKFIADSGDEMSTLKTLPADFGEFFTDKDLLAGDYFSGDSVDEVIVMDRIIHKLYPVEDTEKDSLFSALIGEQIKLATLTLDPQAMLHMFSPLALFGKKKLPIKDSIISFTLCGITKSSAVNDWQAGGYITIRRAETFPRFDFKNINDLLQGTPQNSLETFVVYTSGISNTTAVQEKIANMGLSTNSILDELKEVKKVFLIMDSILGAIGIMALFIATLGLVNTLIMSIYERTKEIGILKALGAKDGQIRKLFIIEAGGLGLLGALLGLPLGWLVTKIADLILFATLLGNLEEEVVLFQFPWFLILGSILFSVLFSMLAGLYPAMRAAKINPVKALRHD